MPLKRRRKSKRKSYVHVVAAKGSLTGEPVVFGVYARQIDARLEMGNLNYRKQELQRSWTSSPSASGGIDPVMFIDGEVQTYKVQFVKR